MSGETCTQIKRERDDLRRQIDDQRYEAEMEADRQYRQRERERKERQRQLNPSNRLYNGDVNDFETAVGCHIAACEEEKRSIVSLQQSDDDDQARKLDGQCKQSLNQSIDKAVRARAIYLIEIEKAYQQVAQELHDAGLEDWADCLKSGDYSSMA